MAYDQGEDRMLVCPRRPAIVAVGENGFSASNYYSMAAGTVMDGSATMTRSVLFRVDSLTGVNQVLVEQWGLNGGWQITLTGSDDKVTWVIRDSTPTNYQVKTAALSAGEVYCVTVTWDGATLRAVLGQVATSTTPGATYATPGSEVPAMGSFSGGTTPATGLTILGFAWSDSVALSEAQAQAHNAASLSAGEMQSFFGVEGLYRANTASGGLSVDLTGNGFTWTENGSVTGNVAVTLDEKPLAYYERADRTDAASFADATLTSVGIHAVSGSTVTVAKTEVLGETIPACSVLEANDEGSLTYALVTAAADSSTYGAGYWDLTVSADTGFSVSAGDTVKVYQGWSAEMLWQAIQLQGLGQRWQEIHVAFESAESEYITAPTADAGGATHLLSSPSSVSPSLPVGLTYTGMFRAGMPRACVRSPHLFPYVRICGAGLRWTLSDVHVYHSPTSRRVKR